VIEWAGRRAARRRDVADAGLRRAERRAGARDERRDDRIGTRLRRGASVAADERGAGTVDASDRGADVGAAKVEAEVKRARCPQTLGSRPATSGAFSAVASAPKTCFRAVR